MNASVNPVQPSSSIADITKTAHGLTLPAGHTIMGVYVDSVTGNILPADASAVASQKVLIVTKIYGVDDIRVQQTGFYTITAHGYNVGEYYYITDAGDGGFSTTPGTINDVAFYAIDNNVILIVDNRPV